MAEEDLRARVLADETVPEPVRRALEKGMTLESLRLDEHGRWWHGGDPIGHARIHQLFSRSVDVTDGGTWILRIWPFTYPITVDDTPYFVVAARVHAEANALWLTLNDGTREQARAGTLRLEGDGRLLARVHDERFEARFLRRAYHDLVDALESDATGAWTLNVGRERWAVT